MKKLLVALSVLCCTAVSALAQSAVTLPIAANAVADIGNGPIKVRMVAGNASIFTSQGSGTGSTSGASTALTLTATPATPPIVGGLISGVGITSGTTVIAYNGTTGITLSAAMTVAGGTAVAWGAACPSTPPSNVIQASPQADYYIMYTQARVCAVSPGGPVNTLLIDPIFYDQATQGGGAGLVGSVSNSDGTLTITPTTGVVIASIALGHPNTWTSTQTFSTSPLVPTAAPGTNNTQAASTAFVQAATATFLNSLCTTAGAFPVYNTVSAAWVCSTVGGAGSQAVLAGPLTINPQSGVIPGFTINQSLSGSSLPTGNAANLIFITGDTAQAGAGFINGSEITHFVGGSAVTGGREAFASFLKLTAPTNASNPNRNYVGIWGNAFSDAGDGGTNTGAGALGALFGSGAWGDLQSGATNLLNVSAAEYNVSARTGASVKHKTIIQAVQHALDAVPGATTDAAIVVSSQGSPATGLTDGLLFSDMAGAQGVKTAGSLIRSTGGTFANGVDFSASTLTTAYKSSGFNVDGSGNVTMNNRAVAGDIWAGTSNKFLDAASAQAALAPQAIAISTSTFTPVIANGINYEITLVHASCPCTIANIASPPVGQSFYLTVIQSATGSDTIGTWGTSYKFPGGTHPTLSTGANAVDILPVYCRTATFCAVVFAGNFQ